MQHLPGWARSLINTHGGEQIERALAEAEARTSGEIVPLVVHRSSAVGHVPVLVFLALMFVALLIDLAGWQAAWFGAHGFWIVADAFVAAAAAVYLGRNDDVQRLCIPAADEVRQVDLRAELEFYELGLRETRGRTGVLLMISVMERRAVVVADKAIAEKLDRTAWKQTVDLMLNGVKRGDLATGMCEAIAACGDVLAEHFPPEPADTNELRNRLIVKE